MAASDPESTPRFPQLAGSAGRPNVTVIGRPRRWISDVYVRLMGMKWRDLVLVFIGGFLSFNAFFTVLYWLSPGCLGDSADPRDPVTLADAFFFSVQTVATIGYGILYPKTLYANVLVTFEIMFGVIGFAMGNGLMFARFSRPTARIMFSNVAVIGRHNGVPTLMFRAANQRHNLILEANVRVVMIRGEVSKEGRVMRRFRDLALERRDNITFILSWTVMHPIDELSPLYGLNEAALADSDFSIVVVMNGTDEDFSQPVHARHTYAAADIRWGKQFRDIIGIGPDGGPSIDYGGFHEVEDDPAL